MVLFIAGDIGGTNSRLQLLQGRRTTLAEDAEAGAGEVLVGEETYPSRDYPSMESIVQLFLKQFNPSNQPVYCMCLAVAGPVTNGVAKITNLPWLVDGPALAAFFRMEHVRVMNDFEGIGYGLLALQRSDLDPIHVPPTGMPEPPAHAVKAVIGAGTGLGECFLTYNGKNYDVYPCEGGHADFAPRNQVEFDIMQHIKKTEKIDRVSIERVTSGLGLPKIYDFLRLKYPGKADPVIAERIASGKEDPGRLIAESSRGAIAGRRCPVAVQAMDLFMQTYGAEAGNLSLKTLPFGGLYIAGGIAAKNMDALLKNQQFVKAFLDKGRMQTVLQRVPIFLITHPQVGLLGSKVICRRIINANPSLPSKL